MPNALLAAPVSSMSSLSFIDSLPADRHDLQDIRFRFKLNNIWTIIANNHQELKPNEVSKDISLHSMVADALPLRQISEVSSYMS